MEHESTAVNPGTPVWQQEPPDPAGTHTAARHAAGAPDHARRDAVVIAAVFCAALGWNVAQSTVGWHHSISGAYQNGFRQAQTALSTVYLARRGPFLAYETPVIGAPWSVPFELPLYQYLVAAGVRHLHTDLVSTGRFVNLAFFYATLAVVWSLLGSLGVASAHRPIFLTLLVTSPLYVFWSRCFMIESTALFLAAAYLDAVVRALRSRTWLPVVVAALTGILATLVKPTTWIAFAALAGLAIAVVAYRSWRQTASFGVQRMAILACACFLVPLLALSAWTRYADAVKSQSAIGSEMRSDAPVVKHHLYGTLAQRLDPQTWETIVDRTVPDVTGRCAGLLLPVVALMATRRRWGWYAAALGAFVLPIAVFTNLHVVHNYYAYANGIFLLVASGWAIEGLLRARPTLHWLAHGLLIACAAIAVYGYHHPGVRHDFPAYSGASFTGYGAEQARDEQAAARLGTLVRQATRRNAVVVGIGLDWSSELPFYAKRRALMIPNWAPRDLQTPMIDGSLAHLRPDEVDALVECPGSSKDDGFARQLAARLGLDAEPRPVEWCSMFTRRASKG